MVRFKIIIYWLPIWFQGVLAATPTQSGVNFFPTVISDVLAAVIGAGIVTQLGWWNPFMLLAELLVCLGGGLLTTIYPNISGAHWIGYQIFGGIGYSLASNLVLYTLNHSSHFIGHIPHVLIHSHRLVTYSYAVLSASRPRSSGLIDSLGNYIH